VSSLGAKSSEAIILTTELFLRPSSTSAKWCCGNHSHFTIDGKVVGMVFVWKLLERFRAFVSFKFICNSIAPTYGAAVLYVRTSVCMMLKGVKCECASYRRASVWMPLSNTWDTHIELGFLNGSQAYQFRIRRCELEISRLSHRDSSLLSDPVPKYKTSAALCSFCFHTKWCMVKF